MQKEIHPTYYPEAKVTCSCGAVFTVGSTKPEIHIEICRNCHPFYTGGGKIIDTAGRVEKFKARVMAKKSAAGGAHKPRAAKKTEVGK